MLGVGVVLNVAARPDLKKTILTAGNQNMRKPLLTSNQQGLRL